VSQCDYNCLGAEFCGPKQHSNSDSKMFSIGPQDTTVSSSSSNIATLRKSCYSMVYCSIPWSISTLLLLRNRDCMLIGCIYGATYITSVLTE